MQAALGAASLLTRERPEAVASFRKAIAIDSLNMVLANTFAIWTAAERGRRRRHDASMEGCSET